jgi:hypothetical protein
VTSTPVPTRVRPAGRADRVRRVGPPLLAAGGLLAVSLALHLRDPHEAGSWGFCPFYVATGAFCPGCGGLRAVNDLTHGDVAAAASSNLLVVAAVPVLAALWVRWFRGRWSGAARPLPSPLVVAASVAALVALVLFGVLRNVPAGGWLAP